MWSTKEEEEEAGEEEEEVDEDVGITVRAGGGHLRQLRAVCSFDTSDPQQQQQQNRVQDVSFASFAPGQAGRVMLLCGNRLLMYDLEKGSSTSASPSARGRLEGKGHTDLCCGAWNPHQSCQTYAAASDSSVRAWDVRAMKQAWQVEYSPGGGGGWQQGVVRSLDFNPNKQYHLATAGDDGHTR